MHKFQRFGLPLSIVIISLALVGAGRFIWLTWYNPCDVDAVLDASVLLKSQLESFDNTSQVATSASRTSVVLPVSTLQQTLMNTQQLPVPVCMRTAKNELTDYMGTVIRAFLAYGAGETDTIIQDLLKQSNRHYDNFQAELEAVRECAPFCFR